jgi:hypothetical protein
MCPAADTVVATGLPTGVPKMPLEPLQLCVIGALAFAPKALRRGLAVAFGGGGNGSEYGSWLWPVEFVVALSCAFANDPAW